MGPRRRRRAGAGDRSAAVPAAGRGGCPLAVAVDAVDVAVRGRVRGGHLRCRRRVRPDGAAGQPMTGESIEDVLLRMEETLAELVDGKDARRFFHATYLRTTRAIADEIDHGGFADDD